MLGFFLKRRSRQQYVANKEAARVLVHARLIHFSGLYGVSIRKVFIKNLTSRWGSCSQKGNLNFNYKLLFLPAEIADYIIVHEVCHLLEFNHSKKFWDHVAKTVPNHTALRCRLREIEKGRLGV